MGWTVLLTHSGTLLPLLCPRQSRLIFHTQNCSCPSAQLHGHRPLSPAAFHLCAKASLIFQAVPHAFPQGLSEHVPRPVAADLSDVTETCHTPFPALSSQGRQCGTELGLRNHQNYSILFSSQRQQIPQGVLYSWNIPLHPSLAAGRDTVQCPVPSLLPTRGCSPERVPIPALRISHFPSARQSLFL